MTRREMAAGACGLVLGAVITYVDARPGWDDTGITALAVLSAAGLLGLVAPSKPWLWAIVVGAWIPLLGIVRGGNYGSLLALAFAFAGAYAGLAVRRSLFT